MNPVTALVEKGATRQQASAIAYGSVALPAAVVGLWFADRPVAQALLIVIAVSAPRGLLALVAQWGRPGAGEPLVPESSTWPAIRGRRI